MALCFDQNNDVKEENNFDQNIMPYYTSGSVTKGHYTHIKRRALPEEVK